MPHIGLAVSFTCVICFRSIRSPAQTSGGLSNDDRISAMLFVFDTATLIINPPAPTESGSVRLKSVDSSRVSLLYTNKCDEPPLISAIPICWLSSHSNHAGLAARSGVTSFGSPPVAGIT